MIPDLIATRKAFLSNIFVTLIIFCRRRWNRACCYLLLILRSYRRRFAHYDELISPFRSLHEAMILINQHKTEVVELRHWAKCRRRKTEKHCNKAPHMRNGNYWSKVFMTSKTFSYLTTLSIGGRFDYAIRRRKKKFKEREISLQWRSWEKKFSNLNDWQSVEMMIFSLVMLDPYQQ